MAASSDTARLSVPGTDTTAAPRRPPSRRALRTRFLSILIAIAFGAATVLFGIWEVMGYRGQLTALESKLADVARIQSAILETPVWNLESDRIALILQSILQDRDFVKATVTDETGAMLGHASTDNEQQFVTNSQAIVRQTGRDTRILGELTIVATDARINDVVVERLKLNLALVVLLILSAVVAAYLSFQRTISQPISRLLAAIERYRRSGARQRVTWNSNDEMGVLVSEFNALQEARHSYEQELKLSNDRLEDRVRERTAELEQARNVAFAASQAKSEFLAVMSHELRTPLNGVLGLTEVLEEEPLSDAQHEHVVLIRESGEALLVLLNDILDLSKIESGSMQLSARPTDIQDLVSRTVAIWRTLAAERELEFFVKFTGAGLTPLNVDDVRVRQILNNLLSNAFKFTTHGSIGLVVDVAIGADGRSTVRFEVHDTGIGIAREFHDHVFSRFTQADASTTRRFGGTGLGLAICKELASIMEGEVGLESELNKGSIFWFSICAEPAVLPEASVLADEPPRRPESSMDTLRILIAEDNAINQKVIVALLRSTGADLTLVTNGAEAVAAIRAQSFDLVLMDIQMPELDGPGAARQIRALDDPVRAGTPIVALTANAMQGDEQKYLAAGMNAYVSKPIDKRTLMRTIDELTQSSARPRPAATKPTAAATS